MNILVIFHKEGISYFRVETRKYLSVISVKYSANYQYQLSNFDNRLCSLIGALQCGNTLSIQLSADKKSMVANGLPKKLAVSLFDSRRSANILSIKKIFSRNS